jgi:hypothetical protein
VDRVQFDDPRRGQLHVFYVGTKVDPRAKDEWNVSMTFYMHAGHYKPQGIYNSIKYDPLNVRPQCVSCNKWLHGNLGAYAIAIREAIWIWDFADESNGGRNSISITPFRRSKR